MLAKMTWREFVEWQGFFATDPFGGRRMDMLFALLRSDIHNALRDEKDSVVEPGDLMPDFGKSPEERRREERERARKTTQKIRRVLGGG